MPQILDYGVQIFPSFPSLAVHLISISILVQDKLIWKAEEFRKL